MIHALDLAEPVLALGIVSGLVLLSALAVMRWCEPRMSQAAGWPRRIYVLLITWASLALVAASPFFGASLVTFASMVYTDYHDDVEAAGALVAVWW